MTFEFDIGDILATGEFSKPNLSALILDKNWDDDEGCVIYTIQHFVNGNISSLLHDTVVALSYEE